MATTFTCDDELGDAFREAIRERFPNGYGQIKREVKRMVNNHILLLKQEQRASK